MLFTHTEHANRRKLNNDDRRPAGNYSRNKNQTDNNDSLSYYKTAAWEGIDMA